MYEIPQDLNKVKPNVFHKSCPARYLLNKVAGKWSLLIIDALKNDNLRNGELMRRVGGISQKMLTQTLRELEEIKIVQRHDMETIPPHVEYSLTNLGISLQEKVCAMDRWIEENMIELISDNPSIELKVI
ncbi:winged helix-turn-helix transcriptional regulator [Kiloniella majae]|uniref:winged helix-turn-helix transcriptional regulator n=1 Tax=Kiloniella majae TaxID=1938558 RepID=UPI000A278B8E|nr:helix-turn-helix domain-containing protein [Kiloniella majae]